MAEHEEETVMMARPSGQIAQARGRASPSAVRADEGRGAEPLPSSYFEPLERAQVELGNRLLGMFPVPHERGPLELARQVLEELTAQSGYRLFLHGLRVFPSGFEVPDLGHAFMTRFELPPASSVGVLVCELALAQELLGAMLGEPEVERRVGPLSARDFGLLTYALLRCLDELVEHHGAPPFVLGAAPPTRAELEGVWSRGGELAELVVLVSAPEHAGFVRLFIPADMIAQLEQVAATERPAGLARQAAQSSALARARVQMPAALAWAPISRFELLGLALGDVIVPTAHGVELPGIAAPQAPARLYVSARRGRYVSGRARVARGRWRFEITQVGPMRAEEMMTQADEPSSQDEPVSEADTSHLMEEAELVLEVRVGQARLSVQELASLRVGQVVDLGAPLGQPVSLVAGGEVIGAGELVNVEGRLGVRVTSRR